MCKGGGSHVDIWVKCGASDRSQQCKFPGGVAGLVCSRKCTKAGVAREKEEE